MVVYKDHHTESNLNLLNINFQACRIRAGLLIICSAARSACRDVHSLVLTQHSIPVPRRYSVTTVHTQMSLLATRVQLRAFVEGARIRAPHTSASHVRTSAQCLDVSNTVPADRLCVVASQPFSAPVGCSLRR